MKPSTRRVAAQLALVASSSLVLAPTVLADLSPRKLTLTATLRPAQVLVAPTLTAPDAKATFEATVDLRYRGGYGHAIWPRLRATHLTSPIRSVHIHRGAPGVAGAVITTICERRAKLAPPCGALREGFFNWTAANRFGPLLHGQTYVDVHTTRNPAGELRGQLTVRPQP